MLLVSPFHDLPFLANENNRQMGDIFLVFDFMEHDLGGLLNRGVEFTVSEIKCLSKQLFDGIF